MAIDPTKPDEGSATTQSVRDNFQATIDDLAAQLVLIQQNASDIAQNASDNRARQLDRPRLPR